MKARITCQNPKYYQFWLIILIILTPILKGICQQENLHRTEIADNPARQVYFNDHFHQVSDLKIPDNYNSVEPVKNVILMIGDGMGLSHVYAASVANNGALHMLKFTHTGLASTQSSDNEISDSAAGATALACGVKTYNGAIGVNAEGKKVETILEKAANSGMATGLVATCRITHATPASFVSHQPDRYMYEAIAKDFINSDIDVFIGGGKNDFTDREDGLNLLDDLKSNGYQIIDNVQELPNVKEGKLAGLIHREDQARYSYGRGNMLEIATKTSLDILANDPDGFFLMIEGSQIDWASHYNDTGYMIEEMLDFDRSVGIVLEFAMQNPGTLVVITSDHETGGFSVLDVSKNLGKVEGSFSTTNHTGIMVPVYAFGSQSHRFIGIYENTQIFFNLMSVLDFSIAQKFSD